MRVLFLTPLLPYPPASGGAIKTWTLLEFLQGLARVDLLCFRHGDLSAGQVEYTRRFPGDIETLRLERPRSALNLARSYLAGVPLSIYRNASAKMRATARRRLAEEAYDAVFIDHWLMAQYLPDGFAGLKILHLHNAETLVWQRQVELERQPLRRLVLRAETRRVRRYEARILSRFDRVYAVSEADCNFLASLGGARDALGILPNVPDPTLLDAPALDMRAAGRDVLYLGTLNWQPNAQGLLTFLREAFPTFARDLSGSRLIIAGSEPPDELRRLAAGQSAIELLSPAPDAEPLYRRARVFLETVRGGGGTKLKVLNALARGLPVVTTPDGAYGIEAVDGEHLLVGAGTPQLLAAVQRLLEDENLWRRLSEGGRRLVRERYRAEVAFAPLAELLVGVNAGPADK